MWVREMGGGYSGSFGGECITGLGEGRKDSIAKKTGYRLMAKMDQFELEWRISLTKQTMADVTTGDFAGDADPGKDD